MSQTSASPVLPALLLGLFALSAAALLGLGNMFTHEPIKQRQREDLERSLKMVIPAHLHDNDLLADTITGSNEKGQVFTIYRALKKGRVSAIAFERHEHGYASIHMIMGIDAAGRVLGVRVVRHEETPGLGDKIEIKKSDWIKGFDGRSLENTPRREWNVKKEGGVFDQFSGATITPRAVVRSVHRGLIYFRAHKKALLAAPVEGRKGGAGS